MRRLLITCSTGALLGSGLALWAVPALAAKVPLRGGQTAGMQPVRVPTTEVGGPSAAQQSNSGDIQTMVGAASKANPADRTSAGAHAWPAVAPPAASSKARSQEATVAGTGSAYTALAPSRLLDTRTTAPLGPNSSLNLTVAGVSGVPSTATAVTLNVTVTDTTAASYLSVYPAGGSQPTVSNLNWTRGETVPNLVIVPVGTGGQTTLYNDAGSADVIVDLEGYFAPETASSTAGSYVPLTPARVTDTRSGSGYPNAGEPLVAGGSLNVLLAGAGDIPTSGAAAALINVTVTDTTAAGYLTVYPAGNSLPTASNLNWAANETVANRVLVPVSASGQVTLYNAAGSTEVTVDVDGYFTDGATTPASASLFTSLSPVRALDTRVSGGELGPGGSLSLGLAGTDGIASNATAVVTNVTAVDTTAASYFTVYPGASRPTASDLDWSAGQTVPNLTLATLSSSGSISIYNHGGRANVIVDAFGYFSPLPKALAIATASLPSGTVGVTYTATLVASGGTAPYSWTITTGSLPVGLALSSSGVITGTPSAAATSDFTLQVTDSTTPTTETAMAQLSIVVATATTPPPSTTPTITSPNWSGYGVGGGPYTAVSGTFTVPSLYNTDPAGTDMSEWVGIDGFSDSSLIQAGIQEYPDPSDTDLFYIVPWWEILPANQTNITGMTIAPGNSITVDIGQLSGTTWAITLEDDSTEQSFTTDRTYSADLSSAEWIVEAPDENESPTQLADYSATGFSGMGITGTETSLNEIVMVQSGVQVSTPSALVSGAFNIAYGDIAPAAP